jgi:hypothetical protein
MSISSPQNIPQHHVRIEGTPDQKSEQLEPVPTTIPTTNSWNAASKGLRWPQDRVYIGNQTGKYLQKTCTKAMWSMDPPGVACRGTVGGPTVQQPPALVAQVQSWRGQPQKPRHDNSRHEKRLRWKGKPTKNTSHNNGGRYHAPNTNQYGNNMPYQYTNGYIGGYSESPSWNQYRARLSDQYGVLPTGQYGFDQPTSSTPSDSPVLPHTGPDSNQPYRCSGSPAPSFIPSNYMHRGNPPEVHTPAIIPTSTHDLRVGASEFRPGANGHGF